MTILLVDDNESVVYVVGRLLGMENLDYISFTKPIEALSQFKKNSYTLAILDLMMPEMSGFTLAKKLRELDPGLPIIFCSASQPHPSVINECLALKNTRFVVKPIDVNIFISTIKTTMREPSGT